MKTTISVKRSDKWVAEQRLARAENVPDTIGVTLDVAEFSEATRQFLLSIGDGQYRESYCGFGYDNCFDWNRYCNNKAYPEVNSDAPTAKELEEAIAFLWARLDERKGQQEREQEEREEKKRAEREAQEAKNRFEREARELLKGELDALRARVEQQKLHLNRLADFIREVPIAERRDIIKRMAKSVTEGVIDDAEKRLAEELEDANPYRGVLFNLVDEDDEEEDEDN